MRKSISFYNVVSCEKCKIAVREDIRVDQIYRRNPYLEISFPGDEIRGRGTVRAKNIRSTT